MTKRIIPEELDALIQEYLTDGVLTDKERQVILKRAEKMGLDRDEIDLYLDAQVQKIDMAIDAAARKQKGKSCPFCGGHVPLLTDKCPHCGELITAEAGEELHEILENLEDALIDFKGRKNFERSKAEVERYVRTAKLYYSSNPKIKMLLAEIDEEMAATEKKVQAAERSEKINAILSNKKMWHIIMIVVCLCMAIYGYGNGFKDHNLIHLVIGFVGLIGFLYSLK